MRQFNEFCRIISLGEGLHSLSALAKLSVSYYIVTNYYIIGCKKSYASIHILEFNHYLISSSVVRCPCSDFKNMLRMAPYKLSYYYYSYYYFKICIRERDKEVTGRCYEC